MPRRFRSNSAQTNSPRPATGWSSSRATGSQGSGSGRAQYAHGHEAARGLPGRLSQGRLQHPFHDGGTAGRVYRIRRGPRYGVWSTDGTGAGTRLIGDFCSGSCSSQPSSIVSGFGRLLFPAGGALWSTDGTPQGTVRLANFDGWSFSDLPFGQPFRLVFAGQKAFFSTGHQQRGQQLWVTDGTPEGTGLVSLIGDTGPGSAPREPLLSATTSCFPRATARARASGAAAARRRRPCLSRLYGKAAPPPRSSRKVR